ncbi:hypothetical protein [Nocardia brasiliensis]|nr:hypothetical protein [Nocardia brasiliensis]MBF6547021.1 hypothetical protein [Nocardia brasiliensis]
MTEWYRSWQPLNFIDELRLDAEWTLDAITERIWSDVVRARGSHYRSG